MRRSVRMYVYDYLCKMSALRSLRTYVEINLHTARMDGFFFYCYTEHNVCFNVQMCVVVRSLFFRLFRYLLPSQVQMQSQIICMHNLFILIARCTCLCLRVYLCGSVLLPFAPLLRVARCSVAVFIFFSLRSKMTCSCWCFVECGFSLLLLSYVIKFKRVSCTGAFISC